MGDLIHLHGVGKRYQKLDEQTASLRALLPFTSATRSEMWALRDLNLRVGRGETVGVLGHNGAGKTTLLRLLAGVTRPTEGRLRVEGRIAPLISLGVGFHQEMSGRENVLINGMLLGLSATQVAERFDEIVAFAELEDFIDTPVKFYSSGMFMRLGFAVVAHVEAKVMLVDEILAVGDAGFQFKCFDRLRSLQEAGAAIVMVSHSMPMISQLCERALVIHRGRLVFDGPTDEAIALHCASMSSSDALVLGAHGIEVLDRRLVGASGRLHHAAYDEPMELQLRLRFQREVHEPSLTFAMTTDTGLPATSHTSRLGPSGCRFRSGDEALVKIGFQARLGGGNYELTVRIHDHDGHVVGVCDGVILFVTGRTGSVGIIDLRAQIEVDGVDRSDARMSYLER